MVKPVKTNYGKLQTVLNPPMQLRIFPQRTEYNLKRDESIKNKTKIVLPAQYSISYPDIGAEVLYILVYIKIYIGNDMDKGHCVCEVLDYRVVNRHKTKSLLIEIKNVVPWI